MSLTRRQFLAGSGAAGALLLGFGAQGVVRAEAAQAVTLAGWLRIDGDGVVTVYSNATEIGQGSPSAFAQIIAEELELGWPQVRVEMAPLDKAHASPLLESYMTGGSSAIRGMLQPLRLAGANARALLLAAARQMLNVPAEELELRGGRVHHSASGRSLGYGELAPLAGSLPLPDKVTPKPREQWRVMGQPLQRLDLRAKVDGSAVYGIDVKVPGMLYAAIAHCPQFGGKLHSVDDSAALAVPGVRKVVALEAAVAVVADNWWLAQKTLLGLKPQWTAPEAPLDDSAALLKAMRDLAAGLADGTRKGTVWAEEGKPSAPVEQAYNAARHSGVASYSQQYDAPLLAHATLEPMNATADVSAERCVLHVPTQVQFRCRDEVAKALGFKPGQVEVNSTLCGGGFGRRLRADYAVEAALVARACGRPVKLLWSREEDLRHDYYRTASVTRLEAALDQEGMPLALGAFIGCLDGDEPVAGITPTPYKFGPVCAIYAAPPRRVPLGAWRSVDRSQNTFFLESFVDELALRAGRDPLAYRLALLRDNARATRVLQRVAQEIGWHRPRTAKRGIGLALGGDFDSYCAQAVEVQAGKDGALQVLRVVVALDCGTAVNPDSVRAQLEGGVLFALSAAAGEEITVRDGQVVQNNFDSYPLLRLAVAPEVTALVLESPEAKVGGVGEPPVPPLAPALCNAIFAATGTRVRTLPLSKGGFVLNNAG